MWILVWVIVSTTYGPTKMAGTQEFETKKACIEAKDFIVANAGPTGNEKSGAKVSAICVEDPDQ